MENKNTSLVKSLIKNKDLILYLTKNDFKKKFAGSTLGVFWAFAQPMVTVLLYWFVFTHIRDGSNDAYPYILFLLGGLVPWFYFSESIVSATNCFMEYSYLVKKVVFDIEVLPVIKLLSGLITHVFFMAITLLLMLILGVMPTFNSIGFIYYTFCLFMFLFGLTYLTSSINVFLPDLGQFISTILQALMWLTPILWNYETTFTTFSFRIIFKLNPLFYIVQGYRAVLFEGQNIFYNPKLMIYFWVFTIALLVVGNIVFKKLRPHFSDVL